MDACKACDILTVTTTVGSEADAMRLARALVERRFAACVQVDGGVRSCYRWEGRLCEETEWRLVVKTTQRRLADLQEFFREQHPYELPQLVAVPALASAAYAAWVASETS